MELRDILNTQEGYQEIIDKKHQYINEDLIRIKEREEDELNGIQKYPKPNNKIILAIKKGILGQYYSLFEAHYSIGKSLEEIRKEYLNILLHIHKWNIDLGYVKMVEMLSIAIMLEIEDTEFDKLVTLVERDKVKDYVIDLLIRYRKPTWQQTQTFLWNRPYKITEDIVEIAQTDKEKALEHLIKYLKAWYKAIEVKTHESKFNIHTGYWSWEAGAIAKILDLDDGSLKDQQYYPYDMVHFKE